MARTWDRVPDRVARREQDRLLRDWLDTAVRPFSPWWGERLRGITVRGAADLDQVPVVEEDELAAAGGPGNPALLLTPDEVGYKRHARRADLLSGARELRGGGGGSAARRNLLYRRFKAVHVHEAGVAVLLTVAYTRTDLDRLHLAGARMAAVLGLGADDTLVSAVPSGPSVDFWGLYHAALAARITALHPRGAGQAPVAPVARALAMLPATTLAVPVEEAVGLLAALADRGVRTERLATVLAVGPPPDAELRDAVWRAARRLGAEAVRVQAVWAPESSRVLWAECRPRGADPVEASYGLHTYPDLEVVSVRDAGGSTAGEGEPGELVLTSLGWHGTALVRHATGSWTRGMVTGVACPSCGRTVPRLAPEAVEGAWQQPVRTRAGERVRPDLRGASGVLTDAALRRLGVADWSLGAVGETLVLGLVGPSRGSEEIAELARELGRAVGVVPEVRLGVADPDRRLGLVPAR